MKDTSEKAQQKRMFVKKNSKTKEFSLGYVYTEELRSSPGVMHGALLSPCRMRPGHTMFVSLLSFFVPMTLYLVEICTYFITLFPPSSPTTFHKDVEGEAFPKF